MVEAVELHVRRFFRGHSVHFHTWPGPVETRLPGFRVMVIEPGPRTGLWTYLSIGAQQLREGEHGQEFFVLAEKPNDRHVELVTMAAYYSASEDASFRLGVGHTVPIGRPWVPRSALTSLLVSTPYPFGPELEHCDDPRGHVQILWLLPITEAERTYANEHGLEALEQRFDAQAIEYWKPDRPSAV